MGKVLEGRFTTRRGRGTAFVVIGGTVVVGVWP
jgi:hypothetical protein